MPIICVLLNNFQHDIYNKMKDFIKYTTATVVGLILTSVIMTIISIIFFIVFKFLTC